jgi:hypothetical protein
MTPTTVPAPTNAQARMLHILRARGWTIDITARDPDTRALKVHGTDRAGDEFRGEISPLGNLSGEPCDPARRGQMFGMAL